MLSNDLVKLNNLNNWLININNDIKNLNLKSLVKLKSLINQEQDYFNGTLINQLLDSLPNSFVIKSTSGSGNNLIVHDKTKLDISSAKKEINKWLKEKYLLAYGEWHYQQIKPSIVIEELLSDGINFVPVDYKFFCFNGCDEAKGSVGCIAVDLDRYSGHKRLVFDSEWNFLQDVKFGFCNKSEKEIPKPYMYSKMCGVANDLAKPFPTCRIDFFVLNDRFYVGEITFFNGAGFDNVTPIDYNLKMGNWINLPGK